MSPGYFLYNALASLAAPAAAAAAAAKGRLKGNWRQRLGFMPDLPSQGRPRVWLHAASVGEVQVASALARAIKTRAPEAFLWLSTGTDTGRAAAEEQMPEGAPVVTIPLDAFGAPSRAFNRLAPDLIILLETELWPNFIRSARLTGARIMLANGRISKRSVKGYGRVKFFFKEVLAYLDLMAMISEDDRDRILSLGAIPDRVRVAGSAKYDLLISRADRNRVAALGRELGLTGRPVLVAGSTRPGEETLVLDAYVRLAADFPGLHLVLAPRHVNRSREVEALIKSRGLSYVKRSQPGEQKIQDPAVILVDVMGELFYLYGLGRAAFCGASLVPLGGQNPLEPAVWSVPVLYGPSMDDFAGPRDMLEAAGAGQTVADGEELYQKAAALLADPEEALRRGRAGFEALTAHDGASGRLADLALGLWPGKD